MKLYRNELRKFELDVPDEWVFPLKILDLTIKGSSLVFWCGPTESFNIQIGPLIPAPALDETERNFRNYANRKQYSDLKFGTIKVCGREHLWARYRMGYGDWTKKYMLVFNETEYAITATISNNVLNVEQEKSWDEIVKSFRLIQHSSEPIALSFNERLEAASMRFEQGQKFFNSEYFSEAIEQFELGKDIGPDFPWNYCGLSLTLMQMIETEKVSREQIPSYLDRAEENVQKCMHISPNQKDYIELHRIIKEYKKSTTYISKPPHLTCLW